MLSRWIVALLVCLCLPAAGASAATIGDLVGSGGSFTSGDGLLTFSDFAAVSDDSIFDIADAEVSVLSSGFMLDETRLEGFEGVTASWELAFTVTAAAGFALTESTLSFIGRRLSGFDPALSDQLLAATTNLGISIIDTTPGLAARSPELFSATGALDGSQSLRVEVLLEADNFDTGGAVPGEGIASLWNFQQSFAVSPAIPEPSAALLFGMGLLLAGARMRRHA